MEDFYTKNDLQFIYTDTYTNITSRQKPVQTYINSDYWSPVKLGVTKKADFYIREGHVNKRHLLWEREEEKTFKVARIREFQDTDDKTKDTLFVGYVRLDKAVMRITTTTYNLRSLLAEVGGLWNSVYIFFFIFTASIER